MVDRFKAGEKPFSVPLVWEDGFSLFPAEGYMAKSIRELDH
jgi:hypothetical protein